VVIGEAVERALAGTVLVRPGERVGQRGEVAARGAFATKISVRNEGTFVAARRLVERFGAGRVMALNFASARNPGGGFLGGSQAQEESLARSSALYACLLTQPAYYEVHRGERSAFYTDHMIVSPEVPVIRDEEDRLLEEPWGVNVITSPAPNAGAIADNEPERAGEIEGVFRRRIERVLEVAAAWGQRGLVLGAWGCGVFRNDAGMVARLFGEFLLGEGRYAGVFEEVVFAVLDREGGTVGVFGGGVWDDVRGGEGGARRCRDRGSGWGNGGSV
jgi:uncharacterized protein (TIGR02452 family)